MPCLARRITSTVFKSSTACIGGSSGPLLRAARLPESLACFTLLLTTFPLKRSSGCLRIVLCGVWASPCWGGGRRCPSSTFAPMRALTPMHVRWPGRNASTAEFAMLLTNVAVRLRQWRCGWVLLHAWRTPAKVQSNETPRRRGPDSAIVARVRIPPCPAPPPPRAARHIEPRPPALGGHVLVHHGGVVRCVECRRHSRKVAAFVRGRCEGSAAARWADRAAADADAGISVGGGHHRMLSGDVAWCSQCGAYAPRSPAG